MQKLAKIQVLFIFIFQFFLLYLSRSIFNLHFSDEKFYQAKMYIICIHMHKNTCSSDFHIKSDFYALVEFGIVKSQFLFQVKNINKNKNVFLYYLLIDFISF